MAPLACSTGWSKRKIPLAGPRSCRWCGWRQERIHLAEQVRDGVAGWRLWDGKHHALINILFLIWNNWQLTSDFSQNHHMPGTDGSLFKYSMDGTVWVPGATFSCIAKPPLGSQTGKQVCAQQKYDLYRLLYCIRNPKAVRYTASGYGCLNLPSFEAVSKAVETDFTYRFPKM